MATREEMVVQIEAALRKRFFPHVPKVEKLDRAQWREEQHDTDRLSRALAAYALVAYCDIDDSVAVDAITDGSNDGGIDAIHYDRPNNRLVVVQSKFKREGTAPSVDETGKTIDGVEALWDRRIAEFNPAFHAKFDEIEEALEKIGVELHILMAFLGENLGEHAERKLKVFCERLNTPIPRADWKAVGAKQFHDWLIAEQTPPIVNATVVLEHAASVEAPYKAYYGQVKATALAELAEQYGAALFERNIRRYLGSVGVNAAIRNTVSTRPRDLFYLNNGITAVAKVITPALGRPTQKKLGLQQLSIVNGAQTIGAILDAKANGELSPDAHVLITIIELAQGGDELGRQITRARNHQNAVRGPDFAALDPNQERLRRELAAVGMTYFYRPSAEARLRKADTFTMEEAALALACLKFKPLASDAPRRRNAINAVPLVVAAKAEAGRLWSQDDQLYQRLFSDDLPGMRLYHLTQIYRVVEQTLTNAEKPEPPKRASFWRNARLFITMFVGLQHAALLQQPQLLMAEKDRRALTESAIVLGELIYNATESLGFNKGYLAIFRHPTDTQQIADRMLRVLAEQAAAQQPPAPAAPPA